MEETDYRAGLANAIVLFLMLALAWTMGAGCSCRQCHCAPASTLSMPPADYCPCKK